MLVSIKQPLQPVLVSMQVKKIWKEIVPNEDGEKNEVIDDTFKVVIKGKGVFDVTEFQVEVFPHEQQVQEINVIDSRLKICTRDKTTEVKL